MSAVLAKRLAAQALSTPLPTVADVCRRLFGIQGQDLTQVRWALGVRCAGATLADVDRAFASGAIVRAWSMRGTLHVVPSEDLPWLVGVLGARNLARAAGRLRQLGISDGDLRTARSVAEKALRGRTMSREDLFSQLEKAGQGVEKQRGIHLLYCLTQHGLLCQPGEQFALVEDWIARPRALSGDEALGELAKRYFEGHGPAAVDDLAFWAGLTKTVAKRATEIAGVAGTEGGRVPEALFLPGYDEYLLGYSDRSACLAERDFERVVPGGNGVFLPMVVLRGRIVGTWRRAAGRGVVTLRVSPFARLTAAQRRAITDAASGFGTFLDKPVAVTFEA